LSYARVRNEDREEKIEDRHAAILDPPFSILASMEGAGTPLRAENPCVSAADTRTVYRAWGFG